MRANTLATFEEGLSPVRANNREAGCLKKNNNYTLTIEKLLSIQNILNHNRYLEYEFSHSHTNE